MEFTDLVIDALAGLVALAAPVFGLYAFKALRAVASKAGLFAQSLVDGRKEWIVAQVVDATEEVFAAYVKPTVKNAISKVEFEAGKLEYAVVKIVDFIPGVSRKEAEVLVHAHLAKFATGALAFAKDVVEAVKEDDAPKA